MLTLSERWQETYPGAAIGILALKNVTNPESHEALDRRKEELEKVLHMLYGNADRSALRALPNVQPYRTYYKKFNKTYHVLHQLESVAQKGKAIPNTAALVEAMFMAELKNQLLTAGHDLDAVSGSLRVDVATGEESYVGINGLELGTKQGDMMIVDDEGILSSILYGPDQRSRIKPNTTSVLFTVYAPPGINPQQILCHLMDMQAYVQLVTPEAKPTLCYVYENRG
jgi:DNA/RNA-binding domain of Phe-tRNA-synthetase-like protein